MCNYVETNRNSLYISTQWVYQRDCISDQLVKANQTLSALSADDLQSFLLPYWGAYAKQDLYVSAYWNQVILLYWASTFGQESFLGVEGVTFKSPYLEVLAPITMPVWICANFSMQDPSTFTIQNNLVNTRIKTWNSIFSSPTAIQSNVNSIVGSPYFSSFIFESAVSSSVALGAVASIFGFIALVVIFTQNISSTVICTLSLFSICLITVAIKLGTISNTFDLYDGIVLVTLFALFANFPMHFFFHFFNDSDHLRILYYKTEDYEDEFDLLWNLPNSLMYTARYSLRAFLVPFLMMVAVGGYLMTSELIIIQRSGEYLVIISVVSFVYTLSLFPFSLALSVRLAKYDIDYDEKISNAQMFVSEQCGLGSQWVTNSINSMIAALHTALMCCIPTRQATKTAQSDKHRADRSKKIEIVRNRDDNNRDEGSVNGEEGEPFALDIDEMDDEFDESPVHVTTSGKMFSQSGKMFGSPALHAQRSNRSLGSTKNFRMSPRSASVGAGGGSSKKAHPIRAHMHGRDRNLVLLELNAFNLERYTREVTKKEGTLSDAKHASASETKSSGGKEIEKDTVESLPFAMKRFLESSVQSKQNMTTTKPQLKKSSSQRIRERFAEIDEETKQVNSVNKTLREQGNEESTVRHPTTAMSLFEASFLLPMRIITASDTPIVALKSTERKNTIDENIKMKRTTTEVQTSMNSLFAFMSPRSADAAKLKRFADSFKDDVDSSHEVDMDPDTQAYTNANATNSTAAVLNNDINHSQSNTKSPRGSTLMKLFERSFLSTSPRPVNNSDVMKPTDNLKSTDVESSAKYAVIPTADAASLPTESTSVEMSVVEKNNEVDSLMQPDGESTVLSDHEQM